MVEPTSWKGHSFTLMVFAGIVVLCSIFFILGMLVGRSPAQHPPETASAATSANASAVQAVPEAEDKKPELSFDDSALEKHQPVSDPPPPKPEPAPVRPQEVKAPAPANKEASARATKEAPVPANVVNFQINA